MDSNMPILVEDRMSDLRRTADELRLEHEIDLRRPRPGMVRRTIGGLFLALGFRLIGFGAAGRRATIAR